MMLPLSTLALVGFTARPALQPARAHVLHRASQSAFKCALTTSPEIIPKDVLFGNPEYAGPDISPDGKLLAYLRPDEDGILNVWCRTVGASDDRLVTADKYRGIRNANWAEDSKTLLFMQDDGGDENFHLWSIDATDPKAVARDLTPFKGAKAQNLVTNKRFPDTLLVGCNQRDPTKVSATGFQPARRSLCVSHAFSAPRLPLV